jgi:hypothetical protein
MNEHCIRAKSFDQLLLIQLMPSSSCTIIRLAMSPSQTDHSLTRRLAEAAELLQIKLLDHIIIGAPSEGNPVTLALRKQACCQDGKSKSEYQKSRNQSAQCEDSSERDCRFGRASRQRRPDRAVFRYRSQSGDRGAHGYSIACRH